MIEDKEKKEKEKTIYTFTSKDFVNKQGKQIDPFDVFEQFFGNTNKNKSVKKTSKPIHHNILFLPAILLSLAAIVVIIYFGGLIVRQVKQPTPLTPNSVKDLKKTNEQLLEKDKKNINTPKTTNELIKENQKNMVMILCNTSNDYVQASGVIIGRDKMNNLIVLTNYHVIENYIMGTSGQPPCVIRSDTDEWSEYYYGQPTFYLNEISRTDMELSDFAFIMIKSEPRIKTEQVAKDGTKTEVETTKNLLTLNVFPKICSADQLKIGEDLIVLGYPDISGISLPNMGSTAKFTATEGIISSENSTSGYYFNTSAKIDYGSSGGGAFLKTSGCLAGLPTFVRTGEIESLGRVLKAYKLQEEFLYKVINSKEKVDYNKWLDEGKVNEIKPTE